MKQLNLFQECYPDQEKQAVDAIEWKLFIDGASRRNPGPAGAGVCIFKNGEPAFMRGFYLGEKTNNQAEYLALALGIFFVKRYCAPRDVVYVFSDSELLVKQIIGEYKIKNQELKELNRLAHHLLEGIQHSFCHVLREYNKDADKMANEGIDKKHPVPREFLDLLHEKQISL